MNTRRPIHTEVTECQDCYKCVRCCPVKAIVVEDGHASVEPETCVHCGNCVSVCPNRAKKIRDDLPRARQLLKMRSRVYASMAPSFVSEFREYDPEQLVAAMRALGFAGVSETALGAELVTDTVRHWMDERPVGTLISTACPVVVDLITKYYPSLVPLLGDTPSPLMAHAASLRHEYGDDIGVVFVGPCIAKKCESDSCKDMLEVAITFSDLRRWLRDEAIDPAELPGSEHSFVPRRSTWGRSYPVDGGMAQTLFSDATERFARSVHVSGMEGVREVIDGLCEDDEPERPAANGELSCPATSLFLELLACEGGCVNGPGMTCRSPLLHRRRAVVQFSDGPTVSERRLEGTPSLPTRWTPTPVATVAVTEEQITRALLTVGKRRREDQLNCAGCGYDTCRAFARALVAGKAEPAMCVAYMRRLAQKKSNALLKSMPSAAVMVDAELRIVECNRNFARLCGDETELLYDAMPGLEGMQLDTFLPQTELFRALLQNGEEIVNRTLRIGDAIVDASVFSIEDNRLVGAILQDVTAPAMQRSRIIQKTQEVIDKNLSTVQQIAYLLGENASETELILNSIHRSFATEEDAS